LNQVTTIETENPLRKFDEATLKGMPTQIADGGAPRSMFQPANMAEAMELAKLMAAGNFVPPHLRGKPGDCLAVVMQSARWAMDPFAVGNKTYFVNDRMAYEAQLVAAVINSANVLDGRLHPEWEGEGNELVCTITGKLKGDPEPKKRRVPIKNITTRNSPLWKQDPEQQLAYYAQRAWVRLHAPEVLLGVYTPEELAAAEPTAREIAGERRALTAEMLEEQAKEGEGKIVDAEVSEADEAAGEPIEGTVEERPDDAEPGEQEGDDLPPAGSSSEEGGEAAEDDTEDQFLAQIRERLASAQSQQEVAEADAHWVKMRASFDEQAQQEIDGLVTAAFKRVREGGEG